MPILNTIYKPSQAKALEAATGKQVRIVKGRLILADQPAAQPQRVAA